MTPVDFPESNRTLTPPDGMTEDECGTLPVCCEDGVCTSLWQATDEERRAILAGQPVTLRVYSGDTQPPVSLAVEPPPDRVRESGQGFSDVGLRVAIRTEGQWVVAYLATTDTMDGADRIASIRRDILESVPGAFEGWKRVLGEWIRCAVSDATGAVADLIEREPPADA